MVLANSHRIPRVPWYLGGRHGSWHVFAYGTVTLFRRTFQDVRLTRQFVTSGLQCSGTKPAPSTPYGQRLHAWHPDGLGYSPFARRYSGNRCCFLFLGVLRWFTSPSSPRHPMYSDDDDRCSHRPGFPIRKSPDHSLLTAPRGLSQLTTSFIACLRQGILRTPFVA